MSGRKVSMWFFATLLFWFICREGSEGILDEGFVDQGRPRKHEFGAGTACALLGGSSNGIREIASRQGPSARI